MRKLAACWGRVVVVVVVVVVAVQDE